MWIIQQQLILSTFLFFIALRCNIFNILERRIYNKWKVEGYYKIGWCLYGSLLGPSHAWSYTHKTLKGWVLLFLFFNKDNTERLLPACQHWRDAIKQKLYSSKKYWYFTLMLSNVKYLYFDGKYKCYKFISIVTCDMWHQIKAVTLNY